MLIDDDELARDRGELAHTHTHTIREDHSLPSSPPPLTDHHTARQGKAQTTLSPAAARPHDLSSPPEHSLG